MPNSSKHIGSFIPKTGKLEPSKGKNYLFIIAIDDYDNCPKLYNPVKDAKDLLNLLAEKYEFENQNIITLFNADANESNIIHSFRDLARSLTPQDNLIIYFSGHGEYDDIFKEGYWIPSNAGRGAIEDYVPNSKIRTILNAIQSHHTFLIADSCFSGSLFTTGKDVAQNRLDKDPSRWGLTAGRNEIVDDGKPGANSPFADSLIYHLKNNDKPIGVMELCRKVVEDVIANASQTPRGEPLKVEGHRGGQFYFQPRQAEARGIMSEPKPAHQHGSLLHNIPKEMEIGRDTRCEVRIAFEKETLMRNLPDDAKVEILDIRVSNLMEVDLLDPASEQAFEVRTFSQKEQFIEEDEYTQWVFYVKPLKAGTFPLLLKVSVIEFMHGRERKRDIILEETVQIVTEIPETAEIISGYKHATVNFHQGTPDKPKMEESIPESFPPDVPRAPTSTMTKVGGGSFNLEDLTKEMSTVKSAPQPAPSSAPAAAPKRKSNRGRLTRIAGILVILLAAVIVIPNFFQGELEDTMRGDDDSDSVVVNPSESVTKSPSESQNYEGSDYESPAYETPAPSELIKGSWEITEFMQNGTPTPIPSDLKMIYNFDGQNATLSFQNDKQSTPYSLQENTILWGDNVGQIAFLERNTVIIEGTNNVGVFRMEMKRILD